MLLRNLSLDVVAWVAASLFVVGGILLFSASRLSSRLIQGRAARLPSPLRERLLEEWLGELETLIRPIDKLRFAIAIALTRRAVLLDADAATPSPAIASMGETVVSVDDVRVYTAFVSRLSAFMIDAVLSGVLSTVVTALVYARGSFMFTPRTPGDLVVMGLIGSACFLLLQVYMVVRVGASPGKLLLGMRIVAMEGGPLTLRHALLRVAPNLVTSTVHLVVVLLLLITSPDAATIQELPGWTWLNGLTSFTSLAWMVGELSVFFTSYERRALHDLIAGTVVIYKVPRVAAPAV